jgi:hypothetical protein
MELFQNGGVRCQLICQAGYSTLKPVTARQVQITYCIVKKYDQLDSRIQRVLNDL